MKKILIINRSEIAVRIIKTVKEMGYLAILVHSTEDKDSLAVKMSDISVCIGSANSLDSYLNIENILIVATTYNVDAIHPGYGFLSERVEFVTLCEELNLNFIGPTSGAMNQMADKVMALETASKYMKSSGFHVIKHKGRDLKYICDNMTFPIMIKHSLGGGGKGMRIVNKKADLNRLYDEVMSEAKLTDNNPIIFAEKFISNAKHIEIQVMGDKFGNVIHLGSRDCTMQRNNQKLIEEAPARINKSLLNKMYKTSTDICRDINYVGAGTFEYMVVGNEYYFLEMNTRLQVEHTVTEMVTNLDLVKMQIDIALNKPLGIKQSDVKISGHAIECRINAEDPSKNFAPTPGLITKLDIGYDKNLRLDFGVDQGDIISPFYDSMIGKVIVSRKSRETCIKNLIKVLDNSCIEGVSSTIDFNKSLLKQEDFKKYNHTTSYITDNLDNILKGDNDDK